MKNSPVVGVRTSANSIGHLWDLAHLLWNKWETWIQPPADLDSRLQIAVKGIWRLKACSYSWGREKLWLQFASKMPSFWHLLKELQNKKKTLGLESPFSAPGPTTCLDLPLAHAAAWRAHSLDSTSHLQLPQNVFFRLSIQIDIWNVWQMGK